MLKRLKIMFDGKHPLHWYHPRYKKYVEQVRDQGATHFTYEWRDNWVVFFRANQETSAIEECILHVNRSELSPWKETSYKANSAYDPRNRQPPYVNPIEVIFE